MREALTSANVSAVPEKDKWRIPLLEKLIVARLDEHYSGHVENENYLSELIESLVCN